MYDHPRKVMKFGERGFGKSPFFITKCKSNGEHISGADITQRQNKLEFS